MKKFFVLIFLCSSIYADVMYEMETTSQGMMGMGEGITVIRNFIKGDRMRTELKTKSPMLGEIEKFTIIRLDKGVVWVLDNENKEFSEIPLNTVLAETSAAETQDILPEIKIEKFDETKAILKIICDKYVISMNIKSNNDDLQIIQTMWLGTDFSGYNEIMAFNKKILNNITEPSIIGFDKKVIKELQKRISETNGFPLEIEFSLNMQNQGMEILLKTKSIIKKISTVPISDKVFEIPEGYQLNTSLKSN